MFKEHAQEIENMVGNKIEWIEASKATRIITHMSCDITNEALWEHAFEWLIKKAIIFKQITKRFDK